MEVFIVLLSLFGATMAVIPRMCDQRPCSPYQVLESFPDGVELRHYPTQQWVSTAMCMAALDNEKPMKISTFKKLKQYIRGANNDGAHFDMSIPVITQFRITGSPSCPVNATRSFYLPQANPPQPLDNTVVLEQTAAMDLYARAFRGETSKNAHIGNFVAITTAIGEDYQKHPSTVYEEAYFYVVDYTLPKRRRNQYHESWLVALEQRPHHH